MVSTWILYFVVDALGKHFILIKIKVNRNHYICVLTHQIVPYGSFQCEWLKDVIVLGTNCNHLDTQIWRQMLPPFGTLIQGVQILTHRIMRNELQILVDIGIAELLDIKSSKNHHGQCESPMVPQISTMHIDSHVQLYL